MSGKQQKRTHDFDREGPVVSVTFKNKDALYKSYMGFAKNRGLFCPSKDAVKLNERIFMRVLLPGASAPHLVSGTVMWVCGGPQAGFGVALNSDEPCSKLMSAIENDLGGLLKSEQPTYTM